MALKRRGSLAHSRAMSLPLERLRVLDPSTEIAGPYATKLLLDAGVFYFKLSSSSNVDWKSSIELIARFVLATKLFWGNVLFCKPIKTRQIV